MERTELHKIILAKSGSIPKAAKEIGTTRQWLYEIVVNGKRCSYALARAIEEYSNFRVPAVDLVETNYPELVKNMKIPKKTEAA